LGQAEFGLLVAQLSFGLSTEYSKKPAQQDAKSDKVDADRQLYAKYYVSQIMQLGEEGIRDAWSKVGRALSAILAATEGPAVLDMLALLSACTTWARGSPCQCLGYVTALQAVGRALRCCSAALACLST